MKKFFMGIECNCSRNFLWKKKVTVLQLSFPEKYLNQANEKKLFNPLRFYSQTCIRRPLLGPLKSGRLGQVAVL